LAPDELDDAEAEPEPEAFADPDDADAAALVATGDTSLLAAPEWEDEVDAWDAAAGAAAREIF